MDLQRGGEIGPGARGRSLPSISVPYIVLAAALGLAGGWFLSSTLKPGVVKLRESPFGLDAGLRIVRGRDFGGASELGKLPDAQQENFRRAARALESGGADSAVTALRAILRNGQATPLVQAAFALAVSEAMVLGASDKSTGSESQTSPASPAIGTEAVDALASALAKDPDHPWIQYVAGKVDEKSGRLDSAEAHFRRSAQSSPQFAYAALGLARVQSARGEFGPARAGYHKAIGLMESAPEAYAPGKRFVVPVTETLPYDRLAALYYQTGAQDSALMAVEFAEEKGLHTDALSLVKGWLWESHGFLAKADSTYRFLMEKDPANPAYREAEATLGWKPRNRDGRNAAPSDPEAIFALSLLDPLARQHPRNAPLWMALGQAYYRRGLFGLATESFDTSLKYEPALPGLPEKRDAAYQALIRAAGSGPNPPPIRPRSNYSSEEQTPVVIPGSIALLGTYGVPWGSTPTQVRQAYPRKDFKTLANGNLYDTFAMDGLRHEYVLAFKGGRLWGVRVTVTDTSGNNGDVFGRMIRIKTKISGDGKGTGESTCAGTGGFQGVIWENDDTFEFMAQFNKNPRQVRLARLGREFLPQNRRLCDLVGFLSDAAWR